MIARLAFLAAFIASSATADYHIRSRRQAFYPALASAPATLAAAPVASPQFLSAAPAPTLLQASFPQMLSPYSAPLPFGYGQLPYPYAQLPYSPFLGNSAASPFAFQGVGGMRLPGYPFSGGLLSAPVNTVASLAPAVSTLAPAYSTLAPAPISVTTLAPVVSTPEPDVISVAPVAIAANTAY